MREVQRILLNKGEGMATGLYNLINLDTNEITYWFNSKSKDEVMALTDEEYINYFEKNKRR